jgi:aspartate racemase
MTRFDAAPAPARVGVLGGMGPLASAEFVRTLYERVPANREQELPAVMLYSDPSFPDRTESFLSGRDEPVLERLVAALRHLEALKCDRVVMCCITLHHLLPRVPEHLAARVESLVDAAVDALEAEGEPRLLLCTTGTRRMNVFQMHPRWNRVRHLVRLPDDDEQGQVHGWIYRELKRGGTGAAMMPFVRGLLLRHGVDSFIAGCTELHLLRRELAAPSDGLAPVRCLDPLVLAADRVLGAALLPCALELAAA